MPEHWFTIGLITGIITLILSHFLDRICTAFGINLPDQVTEEECKKRWKTFFIVVIIFPIAEEILFRFAVIESIGFFTDSYIYLSIAILISSILFGLIHGSPGNILMQGVIGVFYSIAYCLGGLPASITAHMFDNGILILYLYFLDDPKTEKPTPLYPS